MPPRKEVSDVEWILPFWQLEFYWKLWCMGLDWVDLTSSFLGGIIRRSYSIGCMSNTTGSSFRRHSSVCYRQPAAKEIVQTRYARGEITRDQYQQMLDHLTAFRD